MKNQNSSLRAAIFILASSVAILSATLLSAGCGERFSPGANPIGDRTDRSLGCKNFESEFWDGMNLYVEANGRLPTGEEAKEILAETARKGKRLSRLNEKAALDLAVNAKSFVEEVQKASEIVSSASMDSAPMSEASKPSAGEAEQNEKAKLLRTLAELEIGDRTTDEKSAALDKVMLALGKIASIGAESDLDLTGCSTPSPSTGTGNSPGQDTATAPSPMLEGWKQKRSPAVYGGLKTMATLYQSCEAASQSPLDEQTPNVDGIKTLGKHSSGVGYRRVISNLPAFLSGHPYYDPYKPPQSSCFAVLQTPSIYDFGGKPYTTASDDKYIDLFSNGGTGTDALGIDCSGLVFTAYAAAGKKFKSSEPLKTRHVNGVSSTMLTQPAKNGLDCLAPVVYDSKENLRAGDIIAIKGHVVMVESVGNDPFGIKSIKSASSCASNVSIGNFDFTLLQSSPEKGGVGVNRMEARYYLSPFTTMGRGVVEHAIQACKAQFPGAKPIQSSSTLASIVRHKGTAECSDQPAVLNNEACLSSCPYRP